MSTVIKVENLSKAYQLGQIGTGTISKDIERFFVTKVMGKEDPFLKIGQTNDRTIKGDSDIVWSLKDINFDIQQGDAVGIIGRNGAGKSTLLKLLSRVTSPTTGNIKIKGRIASLLEVGTGFHPELSGRENIFLNGAILGMRKNEIKRKFDEIVDFSGVERYIDTPVKRYSSGMYVRLAFAVAAHLESEILIVDEVLAVGDAEFQKKCLGKMGDISKGEGRTVLFVSHNMAAVQGLCTSGILLNNGLVEIADKIDNCLKHYLQSNLVPSIYKTEKVNKINYFSEIFLSDNEGNIIDSSVYKAKETFLNFKINVSDNVGLKFGCTLLNHMNDNLISFPYSENNGFKEKGNYHLKIKLPIQLFKGGNYHIEAALWKNGQIFDQCDEYISFDIIGSTIFEQNGEGIKGLIINNEQWTVKQF
ncbi:MAG: ABC transporter ATP-binding protein [Flavobacterium sp.]|uniref:ABC transporter ATP-binding protein n=1 Tax=Flavobacterium sp. TaxID=239 RepID=UPI0022C132DD|nr:ABC transporter ATP-binding protein [Flavobacterium sp.]MCZ8197300.1 ABC transporter ATP-binding protein [Flavobacterium sp.]